MAETLSKINVLELGSDFLYGGGQRNMVTFAKYLRKDIFNVTVAVYGQGGPLETVLKSLSLPYLIARGQGDLILDLIKQKKIQAIHFHRSGGSVDIETKIIIGAKKINPNLVIIEKNVFGKYDPTVEGCLSGAFFQSMMHVNERYLPKSGKIFNFDKMKVLYNMIDEGELRNYKVSAEQIVQYKIGLGIKPEDYVLGKVARPGLEKWSDLLIEMMPYLVELIPQVKVIIIGCPPSRIKRIEKSRFKNHFCLLPPTDDQALLHLFYQTIDVLAHSSKIGECNGNTINEAMFWHKPVVTNSTPHKDNGQLEQVKHMVNGIIANTPATFARAIYYLFANKKEYLAMAEAAHKQVQSVNNPRLITSQVEKFLLERSPAIALAGLPEKNEYVSIKYSPSAAEIVNYRQEYRARLSWEFGQATVAERISYWLVWPRRFYFKIRDYLEHNYYGRKI